MTTSSIVTSRREARELALTITTISVAGVTAAATAAALILLGTGLI